MRRVFLLLGVSLLLLLGCEKKKPDPFLALDQAGMFSTSIDQLRQAKASELEISQLVKLKQASAGDELCLALFKAAHDHHHDFSSADAAINLSRAGYSDSQILQMAATDQIDVLSSDAVTLKLIGLSNSTVQLIMERREQGLPTLTSEQISRLKNTGLSEKQILEIVGQGLSNDQAEELISRREAVRNHSNTGFVRVHGRKPR